MRKEPDPVKCHAFAKQYLEWSKANKKFSTYVRDVSVLKFFDAEFERKNIQDFTTWQIEKVKSMRKETLNLAAVNRGSRFSNILLERQLNAGR